MYEYKFSILITHSTTSSFRWEGEFTPEIRGPTAFAYSEILPLPSTIAGVLAYTAWKGKCVSKGLFDSTKSILSGILGTKFSIRGPYFYVNTITRNGEVHEVICLHKYPRKLLCIDASSKKISYIDAEKSGIHHIGIALRNDAKSVIEGLIYTQVEFVPRLLAETIVREIVGSNTLVEDYGILAEIFCSNKDYKESIRNKIIVAGGESRPSLFKVLDRTPFYEFLEKEWTKASASNTLLYIASPIISEYSITNCNLSEPLANPREYVLKYIDKLIGRYLKKKELTVRSYILDPTKSENSERHRVVFTIIGLGYDLCLNIPRPLRGSIMPGALFEATIKDWRQLYIEGIGEYRELGWGTIVPMPTIILNTLQPKADKQ